MSEYCINLDAKNCTGCSACASICPKKCIQMEADTRGFLIPQVNQSICIQCGLCLKTCPILSPLEKSLAGREIPSAYAAQSLDMSIRYQSTSGGIFSELALWVIRQGGYVAGAIYDENQQVCHYITNQETEIARLRQSKYAQSDKKRIYSEVKQLTDSGIMVLFIGCPCEIVGILSYMVKKPKSLILIDFICLGVNSPMVYQKYLEALSLRYRSKVERVWFKYKKYGWEQFCTRVDFKNKKSYVKDRYSDLFMRGYIQKSLYLRPTCYSCPFKGFPRFSDLTLGDFWGVGKVFPEIDKTYGVSAVCVNSTKGEQLIAAIQKKLILRECDIDDIAVQNIRMYSSVSDQSIDEKFYDDLERIGFEKAIKLRVKKSWLFEIRRKLKSKIIIMKKL